MGTTLLGVCPTIHILAHVEKIIGQLTKRSGYLLELYIYLHTPIMPHYQELPLKCKSPPVRNQFPSSPELGG